MDFQNRAGGKTGGGGVASYSDANVDRRERLRQLALETIDLQKDPYFMRNHLGGYECKLCLTLHNNEGSYLAHTQGKKHQANLARRAAKEAADQPFVQLPQSARVEPKKFVKIGRPGYKVTKERDPATGQQALLFQIGAFRFISLFPLNIDALRLSGDRRKHHAAPSLHVCIRAADRAARQALAISSFRRRALREHRLQDPEPRSRQI